jgi:hypothetical protein
MLFGIVFGIITALAIGLVNRAEAHLDPITIQNPMGHTSLYNYTNSTCGNAVDPISVFFYGAADTNNMHTHAHHHGGWTDHSGTGQYFFEHFCGTMNGQDASAVGTRYHMRYFWNYDPGIWQYYSVATPHHEDLLFQSPGCGHAVDSNNNEPPGGFVMGKWDIGFNWHNWNNGGGQHWFGGSWWGGNTGGFVQCDGEWAWNDGYIDFVQIVGPGH